MKTLTEWRAYKTDCALSGVSPKSEHRRSIYFCLIDKYGVDAVIAHAESIKKILDK